MRPTIEDLQSIWLFTYSRAAFIDAAEFVGELDKVATKSLLHRALVDAAIMAYARPFRSCYLPPERERVVPLDGVLPPQRFAVAHQHALDLRDTVIGHTDATPAKGYTSTMNRAVVGLDSDYLSLNSIMIAEMQPRLKKELTELCAYFRQHCETNLSRLKKLYLSEFTKHEPGEYELVIVEPPADWLIPWRIKHGDDFRK
jgi:hypothetical protein